MNDRCRKVLGPLFKTGALVAGLVSGYYHRVFAGSCTNVAGTYVCSGGASPTDTTQSITPGAPLTITTSPGFGIDTSVTGGAAFSLDSSGGLNFTDGNRSSIIGDDEGILAYNHVGGDLSITTNGTVRGGTAGIVAINDGNNLVISAHNTSGGIHGIYAFNDGSGSLSITSSGIADGLASGIKAVNYYSGTNLMISAANISGVFLGLEAYNYGTGSLSISTSGTVSAALYAGIYAVNLGTSLSITAANVFGGDYGILAVNDGSGPLTISTSGSVAGNREGITAANLNGSATEITIGPQSVVRGSWTGIYAYSGMGQPITITVDGRVENSSGSAADPAIVTVGGPTTVRLNGGSHITGAVLLDDYNDTVTLAGYLDGSVSFEGGNDLFIRTAGSVFTGTADGGSGRDTLGFAGVGTVDGSNYINFEHLEIYGGSNTLTGTWVFNNGTATVHNGSLLVNGTLYAPLVTVMQHGLLGGSGSVSGDITVFGTLSPGNSIGTFTVNGSLDFMPGSTYEVELDASGSSDCLETSGPVSISDSTLAVSLRRGLYQNDTKWRLISAEKGIHGRFSSIQSRFSSSTLSLTPYYSGDAMGMVLQRTPYYHFGTTPNQRAVAGALDALLPTATGSMADLLISMDFGMNPSQISATLNGLSPELYTSFAPSAMAVISTFSNIADFRQQETRYVTADSEDAPLWSVWGRTYGHRLNQDGDSLYSGYSLEGEGLVLGVDRSFGNTIRAGMLLGYGSSDLSWDKLAGSGSMNGKHIALYSGAELMGFYLDGRIGYSSLDNSGTRIIATPAFSGSASADFDSNGINATLSAGYDFRIGSMHIGPVASLSYLHLDQDGFTDHGAGPFSVRIDNKSAEVVSGSAGLRFLGTFSPGNWRLRPQARISLIYGSWDDAESLDVHFPGYASAGFRVAGIDREDTALQTTIGLTADYSNSLSLFLNGEITVAENGDTQLLSAGLVWRF